MSKITVKDILKKKGKGKITMLTCYDYSFARILDESGVDIILVGDSLANVVLGIAETRRIEIKEMLNHTQAVARGVSSSLVVADMPYASYQKNPDKCLYYARKFMEAGADAVKIEWFKHCLYVVRRLLKAKIPVMGHIGLTPQTAHLLGGYKVQGRDEKSAFLLLEQARKLQSLGIFSLVLECLPSELSRRISRQLKITTIGIGAGKYCDGQVLVLYDFLGLYKEKKLKFVKVYRDLASEIKSTVHRFKSDIKNGRFPSLKESFFYGKEK